VEKDRPIQVCVDGGRPKTKKHRRGVGKIGEVDGKQIDEKQAPNSWCPLTAVNEVKVVENLCGKGHRWQTKERVLFDCWTEGGNTKGRIELGGDT